MSYLNDIEPDHRAPVVVISFISLMFTLAWITGTICNYSLAMSKFKASKIADTFWLGDPSRGTTVAEIDEHGCFVPPGSVLIADEIRLKNFRISSDDNVLKIRNINTPDVTWALDFTKGPGQIGVKTCPEN